MTIFFSRITDPSDFGRNSSPPFLRMNIDIPGIEYSSALKMCLEKIEKLYGKDTGHHVITNKADGLIDTFLRTMLDIKII